MKRLIKWGLKKSGYKLKRLPIKRPQSGSWPVELLGRLASPATVIDVGVGRGTPDLYRAFSDADLLLVEPLEEFREDVEAILAARPGAVEFVALSSDAGEATIDIGASPMTSSLHQRTALTQKTIVAQRTVPLRTLDHVVADHGFQAPFVLKIDTEGHELAIVRGGPRTLAQTELVVAEVSVAQRFEDSYRFGQLTAELYAVGFDLVELLQVQRNHDHSLRRLDAVYGRITPLT